MAKKTREPTKKCWNCYVRVKLDEDECFACKKKLGPADEHGIAKKPTDWLGYIITTIAIVSALGYAYWLFFVKS